MRSLLGLTASALGALAAVIASLDGDADIVSFFVGLTFLGGVEAWAARAPFEGQRGIAVGAALLWLIAAIAVGVLLIMYAAMGGDGPVPSPEATYLGLTATMYHLGGLYGGVILVLLGAFGPNTWFGDPRG